VVLSLRPKDPKEIIELVGAIWISYLVEVTSFSVLIGTESFRVERDWNDFLD
jgi:hypothetical protein